MDGKTKKVSRAINPDQVKNCLQPKQMRKVQVVYYLSRGGQLEHPHFMELELPYNEELYLRDIKDRLTLLRGKGMPSLFSWSCKRSYKNGYVWNDLSENDVVCPARGLEYVLKGSELFEGCSERYQESTSSKPPMGRYANSEGSMMVYSQEYTALVSAKPAAVPRRSLRIEVDEDVQDIARSHEFPPHVQFAQNNTTPDCKPATRGEVIGSGNSELPCPSRKTHKPCGNIPEQNQIRICESMDRRVSTPEEEEQEPKKEKQEEKEADRNSTELSGGDQSPRSSSSASSEGVAHNGSSDLHELIPAAQSKRPNKSVRFQEQKSHQTSPFNLIQLISCGAVPVKDHGVQMSPHRVSRFARAVETSEAQNSISSSKSGILLQTNVVNRTLEEELECMSENPRRLLEEKEYFSGSLVEAAKAVEEEPDPTLSKCASYNAERSSKSEMAGMAPKDGDHSGDDKAKTKCIPRKKASKKQPKTGAMPETLSKDLISDKDINGSCGNGNSGRWLGIYRFSGHPCIGFT